MAETSYIVYIETTLINDFENYLVSQDVEYQITGHRFGSNRIDMGYSLKIDRESLLAISLMYPLKFISIALNNS